MNTFFKDIERWSVSGNPWSVRRWCSRSLEKDQGDSKAEGTSGSFDGSRVHSRYFVALGGVIQRPSAGGPEGILKAVRLWVTRMRLKKE